MSSVSNAEARAKKEEIENNFDDRGRTSESVMPNTACKRNTDTEQENLFSLISLDMDMCAACVVDKVGLWNFEFFSVLCPRGLGLKIHLLETNREMLIESSSK